MRRLNNRTSEGRTAREVTTARGLPRRPIAALFSLSTVLLAGIALGAPRAPQPPAPPAPTITSQPGDPTSLTSAHFTYADSQAGVTYQCQLDGGGYAGCPAGAVTFPGRLAEGKHTFRVRAAADSKTSAGVTVSWTVDTTPPGVALVDPPNGALIGAGALGHGCPRAAGLCGTAKDASGVTQVLVSIQREDGKWWSGASFAESAETLHAAQLTPGRTTGWSYALPMPPDGHYVLHVRATDGAGNTTPFASTFTIDATPPPAPALLSGPETTTTAKSATFAFTDTESAAGFQCSRDKAKFKRCTSPLLYPSNSRGAHVFRVRATDAAGNLSTAATYSWTVVKAVKATPGKPFTVTGNASGPLAPGISSPLLVTLHNPNSVPITLTALEVAVAAGSSNPGCDGPANLAVTQPDISATNTVSVPAGGQLTLPSGSVHAPSVLMKDLSTNQDACKNASFTFTYSGSAHS
ncbi:MAG: putative internalin [Solirubrobacterales bacterium]|nr:putative internalin [Solirubrobacterales bacterium]